VLTDRLRFGGHGVNTDDDLQKAGYAAAVTADAILDRLKTEWPVISGGWLSLAIVTVIVGGVLWMIVHFFYRKQIANLKRRLPPLCTRKQ
jgi:hypothetical protein